MGAQCNGIVQKAGKLYEILCLLTDGDARLIFRNSVSQDVLGAWPALKMAQGKTLATILKTYKEAIFSKQAKDLAEVKGMRESFVPTMHLPAPLVHCNL